MGFMASLKGTQAIHAHNKGDLVKAKALYQEAVAKGVTEALEAPKKNDSNSGNI